MNVTSIAFIASLFLSSPLWANAQQHHAPTMADTPKAAEKRYQASGIIKQWHARSVTISHSPVADLHWPAMTMAFQLPDAFSEDLKPLPVNTPVAFSFVQSDSGYTLTSITPRQQ
ncbi:copper-binding protein [Brenneria sp. 4F2]|nr:copper-binding protein [Brenneria bubanii]